MKWFAIHTRSRHEKIVRDGLTRKGIEQFLPTVFTTRQWQDRKQRIEVPLFPGYCFARFSLMERQAVLQVSGVAHIVGMGNRPEPIADEELQALHTLVTGPLAYNAFPYLNLNYGAPVQVIHGPLAGVQGTLIRKNKRQRLIIAVHVIHRAAAVEIDAADIVPLAAGIPSRTDLSEAFSMNAPA
jgi:transcription antitermination factor NusG